MRIADMTREQRNAYERYRASRRKAEKLGEWAAFTDLRELHMREPKAPTFSGLTEAQRRRIRDALAEGADRHELRAIYGIGKKVLAAVAAEGRR